MPEGKEVDSMKKRWLSMVLILCLILGLAPVSAVTSRAAGKTFEVTEEASFSSAIGTKSTTGNVNDPTIIKLKNDITLANSYSINYYTDSEFFEGGNCSIRLDL